MQTISTNPGAQAKLALSTSLNATKTELNGAFEAILAEIASNQSGLQNIKTSSSTAAVRNTAAEPQESARNVKQADLGQSTGQRAASGATLSDNSPIQKLRQSLEESDEPLESFSVSAEDKPKLKAVLVKSGFSEKQAEEIVKRSSDEDGEINLGVFFNVLGEYQPIEGPTFAINSEDLPLLIQVLNDMGIPDDDIRQWAANLPTADGKILVQGLNHIFQKAGTKSDGKTVDTSVLKDLLGKLGLTDSEVTTLVTQAADGEGKTDPSKILSVLQQAADKQDLGMAQAMKELAARMKITPVTKKAGGGNKLSAASEIRAKVVKALQESTGAAIGDEQELKSVLKAVAEQTAKTTGLVDSGDAGQAASKHQNALDQASQAQAQINQAAKTMAAAQSANNETAGSKAAKAETIQADAAKAVAGQAAAKAVTGQAAQTTQARGTLPSYVVRQVSDQIVQMVQKQQNTLNLKLKPANLGDLNLEISVKDGSVKAVMITETVAAKHALDAGLDQLKQLLGQQGLKLDRLEVMVNPDSQRQNEYAAGDQSGSGNRKRGGGSPDGSSRASASGISEENQSGGGSLTNGDGERINLFA